MNKEDCLYILDLIPTGSDHPVQINTLEYFTGADARTVKEMIRQVRLAGHPVIAHPNGGYFIPDVNNREDMRIASRFIATMKAHAFSRINVAGALTESIIKLGQVTFDE